MCTARLLIACSACLSDWSHPHPHPTSARAWRLCRRASPCVSRALLFLHPHLRGMHTCTLARGQGRRPAVWMRATHPASQCLASSYLVVCLSRQRRRCCRVAGLAPAMGARHPAQRAACALRASLVGRHHDDRGGGTAATPRCSPGAAAPAARAACAPSRTHAATLPPPVRLRQ